MGLYKKGKLFGVFNILDILVLLAIVLVIVGLVVRNDLLDVVKATASDSKIEFSIRFDRLRSFSYDAINVDDVLYDAETGAQLGTVTAKSKVDFLERIDMPNGTVVFAPSPNRYTVTIVVSGKGKSTADGNFINGSRLVAPNGRIRVSTKRMTSEGIIMSSEAK